MGETAFGPKCGLVAEMRVTHLAGCDTARVERKYAAAAAKHSLPRNATGTHTTAMMFCPIERRFFFVRRPAPGEGCQTISGAGWGRGGGVKPIWIY